MSTPHNSAKMGDIAKLVLMPGDPLRAKFVADTYLENVTQFNNVRGMMGFTGTYKGNRVSVMGSGMGMPSIGIYSYELFKFYGVEAIIRIGTTGAMSADLDVYDVVLVNEAYTDSSFSMVQSGVECHLLKPTEQLQEKLSEGFEKCNVVKHEGTCYSSDVFYCDNPETFRKATEDFKCIVCDMESFGLFHNAKQLGKKAACLLTVSDSLVKHVETTAEERQTAFTNMMEVALSVAEDFQ